MKKTICIAATFLVFSFSAIAQNNNTQPLKAGNLYCAKMKDGMIVVIHQENQITSDIILDNGTTIKPDGTVIMKDGNRIMLKDGECICQDGTIPVKEKDKFE